MVYGESSAKGSDGTATSRIPLTIGIVGHRDLRPEDASRLEGQVREIVAGYRDRYPHTPVMMISALADGADQLAVRACGHLEGVEVLAALPMSLEEYERDFAEGPALDQFRDLVGRATFVATVDELAPDARRMDGPLVVSDPIHRAAAYQRCAQFISAQSHVLLALWDGKAPESVGGTADTVNFRLPSADALPSLGTRVTAWPAERGVQIQVPARRMKHEDPPLSLTGATVDRPRRLLDVKSEHPWVGGSDPLVEHLERLNTTPATDSASLTSRVLAVADGTAGAAQTQFRRISAAVLIAGVLALLGVALEQNLTTSWVFASTMLTFVVTGLLWWGLTRLGMKERFQQYRALAEGARVQAVWLTSGVTTCPSDVYLVNQPDVDWIRRILRTAWLVDRLALEPVNSSAPLTTAKQWVSGQLEYFLGTETRPGAIARSHRRARRYRALGLTGVIIAVAGLLPDGARFAFGSTIPGWASLTGQGMWELGISVAAAAAAYAEVMAFHEVERQYATSVDKFREGSRQIAAAEQGAATEGDLRAVMEQIGTVALLETSSWLALNYDRSVRPI